MSEIYINALKSNHAINVFNVLLILLAVVTSLVTLRLHAFAHAPFKTQLLANWLECAKLGKCEVFGQILYKIFKHFWISFLR